ncbi:MAG: alpha/beta hydrolase [Spirochaetaceae bacterium]|nr:MAG: alpha/beta hydrolase [Spirochaetaceae bacterium]
MKKSSRVARIVLVALGVVFVAAAVVPMVIPITQAGSVSPRDLAGPESRFVRLEGIEIHYEASSAELGKQAFVLLHGFGASTYSWREVVEPLSEIAPVIAFDRPAFGLTERPMQWRGDSPYGPDAQVRIVLALLDHFGVDTAVLVGNSAGGSIAFRFALEHPERVAALILVSPAIYTGGGAPSWIQPLFRLPQINRFGPVLARRIASNGDEFLRRSWFDSSRVTDEILAAYRRPLEIENWDRALWELTRASRADALSDRVAQVTLPVLVVTGDTDRIVPTEQSVKLASDLPNAQLVVIPESGHVAHEETPAPFMEAVRGFIAGHGFPDR